MDALEGQNSDAQMQVFMGKVKNITIENCVFSLLSKHTFLLCTLNWIFGPCNMCFVFKEDVWLYVL